MPFGAITQPSTGGGAGTPTAAGLTALVALARADGASAGDLYQDSDTGRAYRYKTGGAGMLVPAEWYPRLGSLKTQTTGGGQVYLTLADTEADLSARGWTVESVTTKTAGQPLELDGAGAGGGNSQRIQTNTGAAGNYTHPSTEGVFVMARVANSVNSDVDSSGSRLLSLLNGQRRCRYVGGLDNTAGQITLGDNTGTTTPAFSINQEPGARILLGTDPGWVAFFAPAADGYAVAERLDVAGQVVSAQYSDLQTTSSTYLLGFISSHPDVKKFQYYELFAYGVA